ncbi:MAG TPA: hypothetical protein PKD26_03320 [Pyrinomonadaceae bacterium]|nr:hypothetical protein [Pyrinomonadaceae bacterium]
MTMISIWDYAAQRVANKSVAARIKHSPKLHALRSALSTKGSAMSKGAAVGTMLLRLGISAIPIPSIATSLINVAQQAVEKKIRSHLHQRSLGKATTDEEKVKFTLKELSVEDLDRYRWKLKEAIDQLNQKVTAIDGLYATKQKESKPCDAWLDLAEALAQAERRFNILSQSAGGLKAAMDEALRWADKQMVEINKFKTSLGGKFQTAIDTETTEADKQEKASKGGADLFMNARHLNCSNYCHWNEVAATENAQWTAAKIKLALVAKTVADPIQLESFLTTSADPYSMPSSSSSAASTGP